MLGCGSSVGSPVLGRDAIGIDEKDWRTRSSLYVTVEDINILIDTTPDFRQQALKNNIKNIDFVLYTHCLLYTSPSPRDKRQSRMPSSA